MGFVSPGGDSSRRCVDNDCRGKWRWNSSLKLELASDRDVFRMMASILQESRIGFSLRISARMEVVDVSSSLKASALAPRCCALPGPHTTAQSKHPVLRIYTR